MMTGLHQRRNSHRKPAVPLGPPIAPVIISRVPVFQPSFKRAALAGGTWETSWGVVKVTGRLTETHRKVLDAIFTDHVAEKTLETGARVIVIDPYKIEKLAHVAANPKWLLALLKDMREASVEITDKTTGLRHWGSIVSEVWEVKRRENLPGGALTGTRPLFAVTISAAWMRIYDTSLIVKYGNLLPTVNKIESGAVHALALHVLTHQMGHFVVDDLLKRVGALRDDISPQRRRSLRREVLAAEATLASIGMSIYRRDRCLMISYTPDLGVAFRKPAAITSPAAP